MAIQQGDQYAIEVAIRFNGEEVSPQTPDLEDVRIQFGETLKEYSAGEISYNSIIKKWLFPMTEAMSKKYSGVVTMQVGLKFANNQWKYASNQLVTDDSSLITESWA